MESELNVEYETPSTTPTADEGTPSDDSQDENADSSPTGSPGLSAGALPVLDRKTNFRHVREIGIFTAQRNFQEMFDCLDQNYRRDFLRWVSEEYDTRRTSFFNYTLGMDGQAPVDSFAGLDPSATQRTMTMLTIAAELRAKLPTDAMAPGEKVVFPTNGANADCAPEATLHVDSFLYTDDDVDYMTETGRLAHHYCKDCKSHNVAPITYVSHSASLAQLKHVFSNLLPNLAGKTLVDVGSRLGNFLYGGFLLSEASELIGVEIDKHFSELSQGMLEKHSMSSRCKVINSDIRDQSELLQRADVVVLNNVFEFFLPEEEQIKMWQFLHQSIRRPGCYLLTVPSLAKTFSTLGIKDIDLASWVARADPRGLGNIVSPHVLDDGDDGDDSELGVFYVYTTV